MVPLHMTGKAAVTKLETLEAMDGWRVLDQSEPLNVLKLSWAFKLKYFPYGLVKKFKFQFCLSGGSQIEGMDFFEIYDPVAHWTTSP